jgi:hypothetical protein
MKYTDIISYLKSLGRHRDIKYTAFGDYEEILGPERNNIDYPCLWIESPEGSVLGDLDTMRLQWECAFVVLINSSPDDYAKHITNLSSSLEIAMQLIARMKKDVIDGTILGLDISTTKIQPIWSIHNDNDQGFRVSFLLSSSNADLCYNSTKWA